MISPDNIRALVLLSGGLDSQLAAALLKAQGIAVTGVVFKSIFFDAQAAIKAAESLKIPLKIIDFNDTIISLIEHPAHGFGAGLNPCIDCHTAMIRMAGMIMREEGFNFIATGEVLNERPMSQNRKMLPLIAKESGMEGYILRPLSAKLLEITEPEKNKWVDREKLLALEGRSRRAQLALARELGITSFPQPAGGCLLTDPGYGKRLRDLRTHEELRDLTAIRLLRVGRHFRLGKNKLIVGRNAVDNRLLEEAAGKDLIEHCEADQLLTVRGPNPDCAKVPGSTTPATVNQPVFHTLAAIADRGSGVSPSTLLKTSASVYNNENSKQFIILKPVDVPGPVAIICGKASEKELQFACAICAKYCKAGEGQAVTIEVTAGKEKKMLSVLPAEQSAIDAIRV